MKGSLPWTKIDGGHLDFLVFCCQTQPFQNKMLKSFFIRNLKFRNPGLGLMTKARACKGAGQV